MPRIITQETRQRVTGEYGELIKSMPPMEARLSLMKKYELSNTFMYRLLLQNGFQEKKNAAPKVKEESEFFNWDELRNSPMVSSQYEEPKSRPTFRTITFRKPSGFVAVA